MSGSIHLESLLVAQQPKGMDLEKGVPTSKDGGKFEEVLNTEVEMAETDVEPKPTEGPKVDDVQSPKDERELEVEEIEVAAIDIAVVDMPLPAQLTIPNLLASLVQEELAPEPDQVVQMKDVLPKVEPMEGKVEIPEGMEILAEEGAEVMEIAMTEVVNLEVEVQPEVVSVAQPIASAPAAAPVVAPALKELKAALDKEEPKLASEKLVPAESKEFKDMVRGVEKDQGDHNFKHDGEKSKPMDLRSFSESLYVHKNLLNVETPSFEQKLQATETSHLKPQIIKEIEPLMTRVLLSQTGGEMTIQLKPGNLGALKVDIQVEGEAVKIAFQAENASTRQALQAQVQDLKQSMNLMGLKVDQVQVSQMSMSENSRNENQPQQQQQQFARDEHQGQKQEQQQKQQAAREVFEQELREMSV